jgi:ectopic P granules protein 5
MQFQSNGDIDRVEFLQELQTKLAEKKTTEATEPKAALIWSFIIMSGGQIMKRSDVSKNQLLIIARYFQMNIARPEGWGEGILGAIGLRRDGESNKKKIWMRCLSCAIFSLLSEALEYDEAMNDLKSSLSNKKFADVRLVGLQAISLIESKRETILESFVDLISSLLKMFYQEPYTNSIESCVRW